MSSLAKVGGKRKRPDQEEEDVAGGEVMASPPPKKQGGVSKKQEQQSSASQQKKGKRASTADEYMKEEDDSPDESRSATKHPKKYQQQDLAAGDDDDNDGDDYDPEDEGADLVDFIVPDHQVEESGEEESKSERKGERRHKKHKVIKQLDEDDFDLIHENTGKEVARRKKRLHKMTEAEAPKIKRDEGDYEDETVSKVAAEGESVDMIDTSSRKRLIAPASRRVIDHETAEKAHRIFDDVATLDAKAKQTRKQVKGKGDAPDTLETMYDADELDDQFATKQDQVIQGRDIPERLQLRIGDRLESLMPEEVKSGFEQDLQMEIEFIFNQLLEKRSQQDAFHHHEAEIKSRINQILLFIRSQKFYFDVPMITQYRKHDYQGGQQGLLNEEDVWRIYNLDQDYGKFKTQFSQTRDFLVSLIFAIPEDDDQRPAVQTQLQEMQKCKNMHQLQDFSPLVQFYKHYYKRELEQSQVVKEHATSVTGRILPKIRTSYDLVTTIRDKNKDRLVRFYFIRPQHFIDNLTHQICKHRPDKQHLEFEERLLTMADVVQRDELLSQVIKFTAIELSVQPYLRGHVKQYLIENGILTTSPTEEGTKVIDVFSPSYRVKHIRGQPLKNFTGKIIQDSHTTEGKKDNGDIFLDIVMNEKRGLIKVAMTLPDEARDRIRSDFFSMFTPSDCSQAHHKNSLETMNQLFQEILLPELFKEIRAEFLEAAESHVIGKCKEVFRNLLMTGPFNPHDQKSDISRGVTPGGGRKKPISSLDHVDIPDRPRCNTMGVIMHQVDSSSTIVTAVIVDKYGEVVDHVNFSKLLEPRSMSMKKPPGSSNEEAELRDKKLKLMQHEEILEFQRDRDRFIQAVVNYNVDLVVVGANSLEARRLKKTLDGISENLKSFNRSETPALERTSSKGEQEEKSTRDVSVIWGSLEVPKLFANSHQSQKLHKSFDTVLKQATSLARFEQDPMNEILNLWSFVIQENQVLNLNLHPMQKMINQAKLQDMLEDVSVACVNQVGIDLNLIVNHEHMHILLSFLSGFGPRKAKRFIQLIKKNGGRITTRGQIFQDKFLEKVCFNSSVSFMKIRVPPEDMTASITTDILDQTRIHIESYPLAFKVAWDAYCDKGQYENKNVSEYDKLNAVRQVIANPEYLATLDLQFYKRELSLAHQLSMVVLIDLVYHELQNPFKDPRLYRNLEKARIPLNKLLIMLIEETEQTFHRGVIVTAQITKVLEAREGARGGNGQAICRLDNGLEGRIDKANLDGSDRQISDLIQVGMVITGRIEEIFEKEEAKFGVALNCKRKDLESHANYVQQEGGVTYENEDLINHTFKAAASSGDRDGNQGTRRFVPRRVNHPKFMNVNSANAVEKLRDVDIGEFLFRPSSRGTENITLTWKFYNQNIVHIDIQEHGKVPGASIGTKLQIGREDLFENLQEIVERYIQPSNKFLKDAMLHPKFVACSTGEELDVMLKEEKAQDPNRIPYKFTVLPDYPQHLVLGYIPKMTLVKEYIKVKARGYNFHEQLFKEINMLINWFKAQFKEREYIKYMKRQKSPRAQIPLPPVPKAPEIQEEQKVGGGEWGGINPVWNAQGSASHADQQDFRGGASGGFGSFGRGQGGSNNNNGGCFNCGQQGHMSRECTEPKKERGFGGGFRGARGGARDGGGNMGRGARPELNNNRSGEERSEAGWGGSVQQNSPKFEAPAWGASADTPMSAPIQAWGNADPVQAPAAVGWGNSTPADVEMKPSESAWGAPASSGGNWSEAGQAASSGWGGQDDQNPRSPRNNDWGSQPNDGGGRGSRGRGRGGPGRDNEGSGGFGRGGSNLPGGRACFKCGQEGHFSRECPNAAQSNAGRGGPGGGSRACFKCNQEGHMARECPNPSQNDDGGRGSRGRGRGGFSGPMTCHKCNQEGHMARECPNDEGGDRGGYKRQRRDDGGSFRRGGDDNNNFGGEGGSNAWAASSGAPASDAWGASASGGNEAWGANPVSAPSGSQNQNVGGDAWGANANAEKAADPWGAQPSNDNPQPSAWPSANNENNNQGGGAWGGQSSGGGWQ